MTPTTQTRLALQAQRRCSWCRKPLTRTQMHKQRKCCSNKCRIELHYHNGNKPQFEAIQEPYTEAAVAEANRQIFAGIARVRLQLDALLFAQTPLDDSPEAERLLRVALCGGVVDDEE